MRKQLSHALFTVKALSSYIWLRAKVLFGHKIDTSIIPYGHYCYVPDCEKNANKNPDDYKYYIKPCKYYIQINKRYNACKYLGMITDDPTFDDQCKSCGKNKPDYSIFDEVL